MIRGEPDYPPDQVPRKLAYEAAHPNVAITYHGDHWRAVVTEPDGSTEVNRYTLKALLDKLEGYGLDGSRLGTRRHPAAQPHYTAAPPERRNRSAGPDGHRRSAMANIPAQPYDVYAKLEDPMGVLSIALGQWEDRDDTRPRPQAEVRRAASTAMAEIDRMLAELNAMRARLVSEIRASDDASATRADAMLAGLRDGGQPLPGCSGSLARCQPGAEPQPG